MWTSDGLIERTPNGSHLQERRLRGPEELETNYDDELRLPDLYMPDGKSFPIGELTTPDLC
jgi:hypothetical protein